jgi:O-antigen ligase
MNRIHLLSLLLVGSILFPWIPTVGTAPQLRLEWFILIAALLIFPISREVFTSKVAHWSAITFFAYAVSLLYGAAVMGVAINISDTTEMMKPLLYFMFYAFAASKRYTMAEYRGFLRVAMLSFCIAGSVTIIQFFSPESVAPIVRLWTDEDRIFDYALERATGTMGNPNDLGFLMVTGFALILFTLNDQIVPTKLSLLLLALTFFAVFATGSRTGMVMIASVILTYAYLAMKTSKATLVVIIILTLSVFWLYQTVLSNFATAEGLVGRIQTFTTLDADVAWQTRLLLASELMPIIADSLVFGHGPSKDSFLLGANIDNEYVLTLYRSGIVGLIATGGLVLALALQPNQAIYSSKSTQSKMRNLAVALLLSAGLFAYSAGIFMSFRLFGLLVIIWTVTSNVRFASARDNHKDDMVAQGWR